MSKRLLLALTACLFLCSCKKNYTCACKTTTVLRLSNGDFYTVVNAGETATYSRQMTKKQGEAACEHEQNAVQTNFYNFYTDNGYNPKWPGESVTTACTLQ